MNVSKLIVIVAVAATALVTQAQAQQDSDTQAQAQAQQKRDAEIDHMKTVPRAIRELEKDKEHQNDDLNREMAKPQTY